MFSLLLGVVLTLEACAHKVPPAPHFQFVPWGLEVSCIPGNVPITLYDAKGHLILAYPPFAGDQVTLFFRWQPGRRYRVVLAHRAFWVKAPKTPVVLRLQVFAPLGQRPYEFWLTKGARQLPLSTFTLAGQESCQEIGLLVENLAPGLLKVHFGKQKADLAGEFARKLFTSRFCFARDGGEKELALRLQGVVKLDTALRFRFHRVDLKGAIELVSWRLPTDAFGFIEGHRLEGSLVAPNPFWQKLGYALGIKAKGFSRYDPFAYETLRFHNRLDMPLTLLLKADFLDLKTKRPVSGFYPKRFSSHGFKQPMALVDLPPKGEAEAVLPIFLDKNIPPGEYLARVQVYPFGSKKPLLTLEKRIGVVRGSVFLSAALLAVILWGTAYTGFIFLRLKVLLSRFKLRELVLIALTGAVGFGLDFLGGMASNILYALLGPFNILVGGLVTEVAHYLVLTAMLCLVPKPGVITLGGLITYFMGGLLFGGFRVTDPFFVGARLGVLEVTLLVLRVYGAQGVRGVRLILALGLADALNTAISLLLHMTFFRLFFPGWYIWLSVLVKGFLYTLIGAWIGVLVGQILRRVER